MEALQTRVRQGLATWADVLAEARANPDLGQVRSLLLLAELKLKPPNTREARSRRDAAHAAAERKQGKRFASGLGVGALVVVCATLAGTAGSVFWGDV